MSLRFETPNRVASFWCIALWALYFLLSSLVIEIRGEHLFFAGVFLTCFFVSGLTRKFAMSMIPFLIFGISYDYMRVYPNYMVNSVDITGIYETEKQWFGVWVEGQRITLNEYFASNNSNIFDFFAGIFYLCWVPGPLGLSIYLFFSGKRGLLLRFAWAFLFINLIGFAGYYIHPAAPPWYISEYGTEPVFDTLGNEAGLARFDQLLNTSFFHNLYSRNANVFAAVPSLHSAYCLCAFVYAVIGKLKWYITLPLAVLSMGICWTAVYTSHHYLIDVLLGVTLTLLFVFVWECLILKLSRVNAFYKAYARYIS